jgi:hypothetical protein
MAIARLSLIAAALATAPLAHAADQYGRFTFDLKVDGAGQEQRGQDYSKSKISQSAHVAFTVMRSGDGDDRNFLDHAAANAAMAQHVEASRARAPSQAKQQETMAQAQKALAACKNDMACMQNVAAKLGRETASWSAPPPDTSADEGRYLNYIQVEPAQCKAEFSARIDDSTSGAYADVAGMRPATTKVAVDFKGSEMEKAAVCMGGVTVDKRTGKIMARIAMPEVKGRYVSTDAGKVTADSANSQFSLNADAVKWAFDQINGGARSGSQRGTLKIPAAAPAKGETVLNVEVRWSFDGK